MRRVSFFNIASIIISWLVFGQAYAGNRLIQVAGVETFQPLHGNGQVRRCISDVSDKNLLGLDRPHPLAMPTARQGIPIEDVGASVTVDTTIRILVLRIQFLQEIPDNPRTTGNGNFDMRTYDQFFAEESHYIDPAPHDKAYFNAHMTALRNYWYAVSDTTMDLDWDIFPREDSLAFQLPVTMSYYGAEGDSGWTDPRDQLGNFFIDAVTLADTADPLIDFSLYDAVIIFHAGSDQQNNIPFINNTPDDFYTGFIIMANPIYVDNGTYAVQEGILMPETASQDNRITALNAVMAHEFGHQLGLIDLYNTSNFMTQVGDFALMDNNGLSVGVQLDENFSSVGGTIPLMPCAWSRAFLGFNVPLVVVSGDDIPVTAAAQGHSDSEIIRVPISEFEYFLIENRQPDVDTLPAGYPWDNALIGDTTGVILGPGYGVLENGELVSYPDTEYDRLLPGSGVVIWHVDEYVAYSSFTSVTGEFSGTQFNNYQTNTLQWDSERRFLTVVEADGIIDLGGNYHRGYGENVDFFRAGFGFNSSFTPFTNPSTHSNLGADSHVFITGVTATDTLMTVDIDIDWMVPGWPQMSFPNSSSAPVAVDLDGDDSLEVITSALDKLIIYKSNGDKLIGNNISLSILNFDNSRTILPWGVAAICDTTIVGRPVPADYDADDTLEIAVVSESGYLYLFETEGSGIRDKAALVPGFPIRFSGSGVLAPMAVDFVSTDGMEAILFDEVGGIHVIGITPGDSAVFDLNGEVLSAAAYIAGGSNVIDAAVKNPGGIILSRISSDTAGLDFQQVFESEYFDDAKCNIVSADIDRDDGLPEIIASFSSMLLALESDGGIKWEKNLEGNIGRPVTGDINSDGYPEIVVTCGSRIFAFNYMGVQLSDFPVDLGIYDITGDIEATPVLTDLDNDGTPDIIVGLSDGNIAGYNYRADRIAGFPLPSSFGVNLASAAADIDGDGDMDLLAIENSGYISAWDISSDYVAVNSPWGMIGGVPGNNNYLDPVFNKPIVVNAEQLPFESVYNYPNPASNSTTIRYSLNSDSDISIDIFDFMGENVHSVDLNGIGNIDNEYVWDCSDVASGVYFCRVEADNGQGKRHKIIKIALVK